MLALAGKESVAQIRMDVFMSRSFGTVSQGVVRIDATTDFTLDYHSRSPRAVVLRVAN